MSTPFVALLNRVHRLSAHALAGMHLISSSCLVSQVTPLLLSDAVQSSTACSGKSGWLPRTQYFLWGCLRLAPALAWQLGSEWQGFATALNIPSTASRLAGKHQQPLGSCSLQGSPELPGELGHALCAPADSRRQGGQGRGHGKRRRGTWRIVVLLTRIRHVLGTSQECTLYLAHCLKPQACATPGPCLPCLPVLVLAPAWPLLGPRLSHM